MLHLRVLHLLSGTDALARTSTAGLRADVARLKAELTAATAALAAEEVALDNWSGFKPTSFIRFVMIPLHISLVVAGVVTTMTVIVLLCSGDNIKQSFDEKMRGIKLPNGVVKTRNPIGQVIGTAIAMLVVGMAMAPFMYIASVIEETAKLFAVFSLGHVLAAALLGWSWVHCMWWLGLLSIPVLVLCMMGKHAPHRETAPVGVPKVTTVAEAKVVIPSQTAALGQSAAPNFPPPPNASSNLLGGPAPLHTAPIKETLCEPAALSPSGPSSPSPRFRLGHPLKWAWPWKKRKQKKE